MLDGSLQECLYTCLSEEPPFIGCFTPIEEPTVTNCYCKILDYHGQVDFSCNDNTMCRQPTSLTTKTTSDVVSTKISQGTESSRVDSSNVKPIGSSDRSHAPPAFVSECLKTSWYSLVNVLLASNVI